MCLDLLLEEHLLKMYPGYVFGPYALHAILIKRQRWIFWINLPFIGVAFVLVPLFLKLNFKPSRFSEQLKRVDWIGSVIFIGSTTSFLIPLTWVG